MRNAAVLTAVLLVGVVVSLGVSGTKTANADHVATEQFHSGQAFKVKAKKKKPSCKKLKTIKGIRYLKGETWDYQWRLEQDFKAGVKLSTKYGCGYLKKIHKLWYRRMVAVRLEYGKWFTRTYAKWECIHLHEAAWDGDNNPTYDGGLQMDDGFQDTYGSEFVKLWGDASHWPIWAQLRAAERAFFGYAGYAARYFGPWPTRQYC